MFDLPVQFGGVSIGEMTARLGVKIDRKRIDVIKADQSFCDRRLIGSVVLGHADDDPDQTALWEDADHRIEGAFDVKGFRCNSSHIAIGLTLALAEIDVAELAKFSKGSGRLVVGEIEELEKEIELGIRNPPDSETVLLDEKSEWRKMPLDKLFDVAKRPGKQLIAANLKTVGELADYTAGDYRLTDIDGIGEAAATQIEERLMQFWSDNPDIDVPA